MFVCKNQNKTKFKTYTFTVFEKIIIYYIELFYYIMIFVFNKFFNNKNKYTSFYFIRNNEITRN